MSTRQPTNVPLPLSAARRQFTQWRSRHRSGTRLPKELWDKAVALAQQYGLSKTARTLGLAYGTLKNHVKTAATAPVHPERVRPAFIELLPGTVMPPGLECTIEWEDRGGLTMRMHVKGAGVADLVSLAREFRGGPV